MGPKLKNQMKANKKAPVEQKYINQRKKDSYLADDNNFKKFTEQLAKISLELRDITGDGNCLFRALSDQMEGNETNHLFYRRQICEYMRKNRDEFEPFVVGLAEEIDDNKKKKGDGAAGGNKREDLFEKYIKNLEQSGTYGGNDALVAFARLNDLEINVHQLDQPIWKVNGDFKTASAVKQIHLSYHNGEHYSSIRQIGDTTNRPTSIQIAGAAPVLTKKETKQKYYYEQYEDYDNQYEDDTVSVDVVGELIEESIEQIINVTNCYDVALIKEVYLENNQSIDNTITSLLAMLSLTDTNSQQNHADCKNVDNNTDDETTATTAKNPNKSVKKLNAKDKKFQKKQRQMERQRIKVLEEREKEKTSSKPQVHSDSANVNSDVVIVNNVENQEFKITLTNVEATSI